MDVLFFSQLFGEPDADNDVSPDTELIPNDEYNNGMCVCVCIDNKRN